MTNDGDANRGRHAPVIRTLVNRLQLAPLWVLSILQGMNARSLVRTVPSGRWIAALRGKARIYAVDLDLGALANSSDIRQHITAALGESLENPCITVEDPFHLGESWTFTSSTRRVYELKQPIVYVPSGRAVIRTGDPAASRWVGLAAGSMAPEVHIDDIRPILRRERRHRDLDSPAAVALVPWVPNYFHWIVEVIPSLVRMVSQEGYDSALTVPISRRQILPSFQAESLEVLGLRSMTVSETFVRPRRALLVSTPGLLTMGASDGQQLRDFQSKCLKGFAEEDVPFESLDDAPVFISRSLASRYSPEEKRLEGILKDRGWRILNCERLSLRQQVRLFSKLDFVAGSHGAGLGNVAWMKPNARLVEVGSREYWHASVPLLTKVMNVRYSFHDIQEDGANSTAKFLEDAFTHGG